MGWYIKLSNLQYDQNYYLMNYLGHQPNATLTDSQPSQSAQTMKPNYDVQHKLGNNIWLNKSSVRNIQSSLNSQEDTHHCYNCSCMDKNVKNKKKSYESLRKELKLSRSLSSQRIKFEQNCFRFKLKICSILRMISPQEHETINNLQNSSPDAFIAYCQKNIKQFVKDTKNKLQANQKMITNITKQLHDTQNKINHLKLELSHKARKEELLKEQKKKQMEQIQVLINKKQRTIRELQDQLSKSEQQRMNQDQQNGKGQSINSQKNGKILWQNPQQYQNKYISKQRYSQKLIALVQEWRTILYMTVDYYENILESTKQIQNNS